MAQDVLYSAMEKILQSENAYVNCLVELVESFVVPLQLLLPKWTWKATLTESALTAISDAGTASFVQAHFIFTFKNGFLIVRKFNANESTTKHQ